MCEKIKENKEENKDGKKKNGAVIGFALAIFVLVASMAMIFWVFGAKPVAGSKHITISVTGGNGETVSYELQTNAEFLRQAMEEAGEQGLMFSGTESEYGLMVDTVNRETADYNNGTYWAIFVNGEYGMYGIDSQPVADRDHFSLVLTREK